jgi:DNA-binding MarR family transcriptional regulator
VEAVDRDPAAGELAPHEAAVFGAFLRAYASVVRVLDGDLLAAHGLTLSSYEVLVRLETAPDGQVRMTELARSVRLTPSGLTRLVDRLAADDLIQRRRCVADARGAFAMITLSGRDRLARARVAHADGVRRRFLDRLEPAEREQLAALLERLAAA